MVSFTHPVAVIGAGPVGLVAAAHLSKHNVPFFILESSTQIGHHIRQWKHVTMFSSWQYNVDPVAAELLEKSGWNAPPAEDYPTGQDLIEQYLSPLAELPSISPNIYLQHEVLSIARQGLDKMTSTNREAFPFEIIVRTPNNKKRVLLASAVLDATGVFGKSNSILSSGHSIKEDFTNSRISYQIPDFEKQIERYKDKKIAIVGSGHSALTALLDVIKLRKNYPETDIHWIIRKEQVIDALGGGKNDQLEQRGKLGVLVKSIVDTKAITVHTSYKISEISSNEDSLTLFSTDDRHLDVEQVVVLTGSRPDFSFLQEIRLGIDPVTESTSSLAPLIDPNLHSCGTVRPHGEAELRQPEQGLYLIGSKSYGRAPTFLLATGYEQVRSVVAHLIGDTENATNVQLRLPETGVCKVNLLKPTNNCC